MPVGGGFRGGRGRDPKARLKSARGRRASSTRWLRRQLSDPYVFEARKRGFRSRAAFKLMEIDDRFRFLRPGARVLDLGAAPGGWSQVAVERIKPGPGGGRVVAVDVGELDTIAGAEVVRLDVRDEDAVPALRAALEGPADVVLSDMAAPATGHKATDHLRVMALAEAALDVAEALLAPGGAFLAKVLEGGASGELIARLRKSFAKVKHVKPPASRKDSAEIYVVAMGFRGKPRTPI